MNKNFIAYYAANSDREYFETEKEAIKWLAELHNEECGAASGFSEESCDGEDYIAKITHRSKFTITDLLKDYPWNEEAQAYINADGKEWIHSTEFDEIGKLTIEKN